MCRHNEPVMKDSEMRDGKKSDLEFLVITFNTDEGLSSSTFGFAGRGAEMAGEIANNISANFDPIAAYCKSILGFTSKIDPESNKIVSPSNPGRTAAIAGLRTPLIFLSTDIDPTNVPPVAPAEKTPSALFSLTNFKAPSIEAFFFVLIALAGFSSIEITSG